MSVIPRETIGNLTCRYFRKCAHFWRIPRVRKCAHFRKMCTFLRTWMFVKIQINKYCESQRSVTQNEIICFQILRCFNLHRWQVVCFILKLQRIPYQNPKNVHISQKMCTFLKNVHIFGNVHIFDFFQIGGRPASSSDLVIESSPRVPSASMCFRK